MNSDNTLRPRQFGRGEGIVQPVLEKTDQLSRRLHHQRPPGRKTGGFFTKALPQMPTKSMNVLPPQDAAYLAGLIDGEGTVALSRRHANENRQLVVSISSTERDLVKWALRATGVGKITHKRTVSPVHAPGLTYCVTNRQGLDLLRQVEAYLRSYKRLRARLVLTSYLELTPRNGKYTKEIADRRRRFEDAFARLKAGVDPART